MRRLYLDVDEGGGKYLSFAKKKLQALRERNAFLGLEYGRKLYEFDGTSIYLWTNPQHDRVRIVTAGGPWYFYVLETASGSDTEHWNLGALNGAKLQRVPLNSEAGLARRAARAVGRSVGILHLPGNRARYIGADGNTLSLSDPLGLLTSEISSAAHAFTLGLTKTAHAWVTYDGSAYALAFTDGSVVEKGAPLPSYLNVWVSVAGDQQYYYAAQDLTPVEFDAPAFRYVMYRATAEYPRDVNDNIEAIAPQLVQDVTCVQLGYQNPNTRVSDAYVVATNDHDIITVSPVKYHFEDDIDGFPQAVAGATEIRIGSQLVWSSPGTVSSPSSATPNIDDVWPSVVVGSADKFYVVLLNYEGTIKHSQPTLIEFGRVFMRSLVFTRQENGSYTISQSTYTRDEVSELSMHAAATPVGLRIFLRLIVNGVSTLENRDGWMDETLSFQEVHAGIPGDVDDVATVLGIADARPHVIAMPYGACATYSLYHLTGQRTALQAFSRSDTPSYDEYASLDVTSEIYVRFIVADNEYVYVLAHRGLTEATYPITLFRSDGVITEVPLVLDGQWPRNLVVDEAAREVYSVYRNSGTGESRGVWKRNHITESLTKYTSKIADSPAFIATPVMPMLSEHYRMRLLAKWAEEDEE